MTIIVRPDYHALSVIEKGGDVLVITGKNINKVLENEAINLLEKNNISHRGKALVNMQIMLRSHIPYFSNQMEDIA